MAIGAMYAMESQSASLSYIQWVETTGFCLPRNSQSGVTKALVNAFIDHSQANYMALALFSNGQRPQGSYFFRKSTVSVLNPRDLDSWWRFLLDNRSDSTLFSWNPSVNGKKCPLPFVLGNEEKDANEVVPLFPDDPMSRHISTFGNAFIRLATFLDSLSFRPEYVGGAGTHFWLSPSSMCPVLQEPHEATSPALAKWIDFIFDKIDFSSRDLACESTKILIDAIEQLDDRIGVVRFSIQDVDLHARIKEPFCDNTKNLKTEQVIPVINNVQQLIKRQ